MSRHGGWQAQRSSSGAWGLEPGSGTSLQAAVAPIHHRRAESAYSLDVGLVHVPALLSSASNRRRFETALGVCAAHSCVATAHTHAVLVGKFNLKFLLLYFIQCTRSGRGTETVGRRHWYPEAADTAKKRSLFSDIKYTA